MTLVKIWLDNEKQGTYDLDSYKVVPKDAVVLDLKALEDGVTDLGWPYITRTLRGESIHAMRTRRLIADQIEAQTKPPITEPGWGEKVIAHVRFNEDRLRWVRVDNGTKRHWSCEDDGEYDRTWEELLDPELV